VLVSRILIEMEVAVTYIGRLCGDSLLLVKCFGLLNPGVDVCGDLARNCLIRAEGFRTKGRINVLDVCKEPCRDTVLLCELLSTILES
jgi:hypothetical protein